MERGVFEKYFEEQGLYESILKEKQESQTQETGGEVKQVSDSNSEPQDGQKRL